MKYCCSECGKECEPKITDDSLPYEVGSTVGMHNDYIVESDCCDAVVHDERGECITYYKLKGRMGL
jgi:hypothetical protein